MARTIFLFLIMISCSVSAQKEKKQNIFKNAGDAARIALGKQKLYGGEYLSALSVFREVEVNNPQHAGVKYYVASCYFNLKQYDKAKESLLKAMEIKTDVLPQTYFLLGKLYQKDEEFDKAIEQYNIYKAMPVSDGEEAADADVLLQQCVNAKALMGSPLQVLVQNAGNKINSEYDDKNPCITADGKKLVFTTRRPETTDEPRDVEGDGKFFENIYFAEIDSSTSAFGMARNVGRSVNTKAHDACTGISPDGKQIFIYKNDVNDKSSRGGNIFVSKVSGDKWRTPEPIGKPINSSYWEGGLCVSPDGKKYFFSSERPGGYGNADIWVVEKISRNEWGKPLNLGPLVNTPYDEAAMFLAPDGKTLFFCSNGPKSMGGYDVLRSVFEDGKWSEPVNLGYPINTTSKEGQLTLSADVRYAYVSSDRPGGMGESDVYVIDLKDYAILEKDGKRKTGNGLSILRGVIREGGEGYGVQDVNIVVSNEKNSVIAQTNTNENGEYFLTLRGGKYTLKVNKKGYEEINEEIVLGTGEVETVILEKGYLLKK